MTPNEIKTLVKALKEAESEAMREFNENTEWKPDDSETYAIKLTKAEADFIYVCARCNVRFTKDAGHICEIK